MSKSASAKAKASTSSTSSPPSVPDLANLFSSISASDFSAISSNLKMTPSETTRVQSALKDPTFMALLADYAREIADPSLKAQNEEMLRQVEKEAAKTTKTSSSSAHSTKVEESKRQATFNDLDLD